MTAAPHLDALTLMFSITVASWITAAVSVALSTGHPLHARAFRAWGLAMALMGIGFLFYSFRGVWPWAVTVLAANGVALLSVACGVVAHRRLVGAPDALTGPGLVMAVCLPAIVASRTSEVALATGYFLANASAALLLTLQARVLVRHRRGISGAAGFLSIVSAGLPALGFAWRAIVPFVTHWSHDAPSTTSATTLPLTIFVAIFVIGGTLGLVLLASERQRQALVEESLRDKVTGLYNRTAFERLARDIAGSADGAPVSVVMVDLDRFKRVNDSFGHAAGDITLAHAAQRIACVVRPTDSVVRYGGEEFCVLLPNCSAQQARDVAHRIVEDARQQHVTLRDGSVVRYTVSAGVASGGAHPTDTLPLEHLLGLADRALYRAKDDGRDRYVVAVAA